MSQVTRGIQCRHTVAYPQLFASSRTQCYTPHPLMHSITSCGQVLKGLSMWGIPGTPGIPGTRPSKLWGVSTQQKWERVMLRPPLRNKRLDQIFKVRSWFEMCCVKMGILGCAWVCIHVIPAFRRPKQEACKFEACLGYTARLWLKNKQQTTNKQTSINKKANISNTEWT